MNTPYEVAHDNLATRSLRVAVDLVDDEVHQELTKVRDWSRVIQGPGGLYFMT